MYQNFTDKRLFTARKKYDNTKWLNDFKNATEPDDGKKVYIPVILEMGDATIYLDEIDLQNRLDGASTPLLKYLQRLANNKIAHYHACNQTLENNQRYKPFKILFEV